MKTFPSLGTRTPLLALIITLSGIGRGGPIAAAQTVATEECPELVQLLEPRDWLERLVNPVLETPADVAETIERYRVIRRCFAAGAGPAASFSGRTTTVRRHVELFLSFAAPIETGGDGPVSAETIDLATSRDPAILRLREELGLAPPEGFIFVRYFNERSQMPENIRPAFDNPQTQAVTISRYVAVLTPVPRSLSEGRLIDDAMRATFSHELVHAFLNARLGAAEDFPAWFHEAMAIHFSGSGRAHVVLNPVDGGMLRIGPVVQYEEYERIFLYLESSLGQDSFYRTLREAVERGNAFLVLNAAGLASCDDLVVAANSWARWWPIPASFITGSNALWTLAALAVASLGLFSLWKRWQPAVVGSALERGLRSDLIAAVKTGDAESVGYLLNSGADPNAEADDWSMLTWAVWYGFEQVVEVLLARGAVATDGMVDLAVRQGGSPQMVRMLTDAVTRHDEGSKAQRF